MESFDTFTLPLDFVSLEFILENKFGVVFISNNLKSDDCPICFESVYEKYGARPRCCNATYHRNCLLTYILNHSYNKCSKCSNKFTSIE
jgi:hypothetical protein